MEERIINYENENQVQEIISSMNLEDFLLVEHKPKTKQLFFKKFPTQPETLIISDP
ncbi:MAG: hypothetical protein WC462_00295 [archaeon]